LIEVEANALTLLTLRRHPLSGRMLDYNQDIIDREDLFLVANAMLFFFV